MFKELALTVVHIKPTEKCPTESDHVQTEMVLPDRPEIASICLAAPSKYSPISFHAAK